MKARPILMSSPMVIATLRECAQPGDGKTITRRTMKPQPYPNGFLGNKHELLTIVDELPPDAMLLKVGRGMNQYTTSSYEGWESACPYGMPGDLLWVRERAERLYQNEPDSFFLVYSADKSECPLARPKGWPSIHMPRTASRLTLRITDIRIERLNEISEKDAHAEGCSFEMMSPTGMDNGSAIYGPNGFIELWQSINGAASWQENPYVWVICFEPILKNVDQVLKEMGYEIQTR